MKYQLKCKKCGATIVNFAEWFSHGQQCPQCGSKHAEIEYFNNYSELKDLWVGNPDSFWQYFDFLPLEDRSNIISCSEGAIPIEEWEYLEKWALDQHGIRCKVMVYRNDLNGGTNTFKDVAAAMAAAIFKENGIKSYCVASTGNTATAYSKYLALAGVKFTVFVPNCAYQDSVEEIRSFGQNVIIADGDYAYAKKLAADYAVENGVMISAGNIDPIRVEAKRTMIFEFMRQMGKMPDIYLQAVAGGTGPIAIDKGVREIAPFYPEIKLPKMLLVQQDLCDPMVQAWENAYQNNFPDGYQNNYPIIPNPQTKVSILSTGNPGMFPIVSPIVKKSNGSFLRIKEADIVDLACTAYREQNVILGPASAVCLAGFYRALIEKRINNNDVVLINTGEGAKRAKKFAHLIQNTHE